MTLGSVHEHDGVSCVIAIAGSTEPAIDCRSVRPGWKKIAQGVKGGTYQHWSGWVVEHCGHPTANWPYATFAPGGLMTDLSGNMHGQRDLISAQLAVEAFVAKQIDEHVKAAGSVK